MYTFAFFTLFRCEDIFYNTRILHLKTVKTEESGLREKQKVLLKRYVKISYVHQFAKFYFHLNKFTVTGLR